MTLEPVIYYTHDDNPEFFTFWQGDGYRVIIQSGVAMYVFDNGRTIYLTGRFLSHRLKVLNSVKRAFSNNYDMVTLIEYYGKKIRYLPDNTHLTSSVNNTSYIIDDKLGVYIENEHEIWRLVHRFEHKENHHLIYADGLYICEKCDRVFENFDELSA